MLLKLKGWKQSSGTAEVTVHGVFLDKRVLVDVDITTPYPHSTTARKDRPRDHQLRCGHVWE